MCLVHCSSSSSPSFLCLSFTYLFALSLAVATRCSTVWTWNCPTFCPTPFSFPRIHPRQYCKQNGTSISLVTRHPLRWTHTHRLLPPPRFPLPLFLLLSCLVPFLYTRFLTDLFGLRFCLFDDFRGLAYVSRCLETRDYRICMYIYINGNCYICIFSYSFNSSLKYINFDLFYFNVFKRWKNTNTKI